MCVYPTKDHDSTKAALLNQYRWPNGATVGKLGFFGGDQTLQGRVKAVAQEWIGSNMANLHLNFRPMSETNTDIRIAFQAGKGSWSYLGMYCRQIPEPEPTMNFGWIKADFGRQDAAFGRPSRVRPRPGPNSRASESDGRNQVE